MKTEVFEYCIIDINEDTGYREAIIGPEIIVVEGGENQRDTALLKIGQRHAEEITVDSEILIRPFC